jgi:endonuclease/exonuclease/phosphatase family metal-dependent hydrolase
MHEPSNTAMPDEPVHSGHKIRLMSFNIQVAIASTRTRHYLTHSWKHVLPHSQCFDNLDRIARLVSDYDIVGLQEVDGGSLRSQFINQVEYLAQHGSFPFWYNQTNRNLGKFAQHSNGMLSRFKPSEITEYKLPGMMPGRGALMVRFGQQEHNLAIFLVHLALGRRARQYQLEFISELVNEHTHACLMGDFNCPIESSEMNRLFEQTDLCLPEKSHPTFPSWRPERNIDHILTTSAVKVDQIRVVNEALSDHLPIAMEISLPHEIRLGD